MRSYQVITQHAHELLAISTNENGFALIQEQRMSRPKKKVIVLNAIELKQFIASGQVWLKEG